MNRAVTCLEGREDSEKMGTESGRVWHGHRHGQVRPWMEHQATMHGRNSDLQCDLSSLANNSRHRFHTAAAQGSVSIDVKYLPGCSYCAVHGTHPWSKARAQQPRRLHNLIAISNI